VDGAIFSRTVSGVAVILHDRRAAPWQLVAALILLVVLLATLGTLQYRWLGEVSEAERARMRDGLRARASEFTQAFDRELTRTYSAFHLTSDQIAGGERAALEEAWNRWRVGAPAPGLVRDVYLAQGVTFESAQLQRLDPARHALEPVAWPPELADSLANTHQALPRVLGTPNATAPVLLTDAIDSRIPALIIPITRINSAPAPDVPFTVVADPGGPARVVIVVVDRDQMLHQLIEPLVARYFGEGGASDYLVTVARRDGAGTVVYNSAAATVEASAADVTAGMFDLRADQLTPPPGLFTAAVPPPHLPRLSVTIVRKTNTGDATYVVGSNEPGAWQVRVRHRAGSLDAIVAASRRRNLAIGLGVLALLAASFVLVIAAAQRQHRLARQQMEFVAAVSHELRTPLAVICSAGENLADGVVSEPAQVQRYGSLIGTEGRRLGDMVERVLQFAGISSGTTMRADANVDVAAVITDAVAAIAAEAGDRAVAVSVTAPTALPPVTGDANALRSAMQNVIGNAVKYSESGGRVNVAAELLHDGAVVRIRVADRGIGIDAADLPHVFEPFYRGRRAVDAQVRGSGVGLSVVQHVIRTHGGDVHIESRAGQGTTVTLVLPSASTTAAADGRARTAVRLRRGTASAES
jgi:signal transduction histidine kinase